MKKIKYLIAAVVLMISFSCSDSKVIADSYGNITIKLTDAPMPYDQFIEASITIDKVEIGLASDPNSFIVIMDESKTFNMINMINGITEILTSATIPEGRYDTLRLYISSTKMVMNSGESFTYDVSQNNMSGGMMGNGMSFNNNTGSIDMSFDPIIDVHMGSENNFLMDIDINNSFMLEGVSFSGMGSGMMSMTGFTFNPTMRLVNLKEAGTISGYVHMDTISLSHVNISLMQNGNVYATTHTDIGGHYKLIGIPSGTYTIMAEAEGYMMNDTENEGNMGNIQMMKQGAMTIDFDMIPSN